MKGPESTRLAKDIMRFYLRNQHVAETLEGLARWRLQEEQVSRTVRDVQAALEGLVEAGYLLAVSRGERTLFRINPARVEELSELLAEAGSESPNPGETGPQRS